MTRYAPRDTWPRMAQTVNDAAAGLHAEYGEQGVPSDVLKREIERISGSGRLDFDPRLQHTVGNQ